MTRALLFALLLLPLAGCETLSYYRQGLSGQLAFYGARLPIADVLAREDIAPDVRRRLALVPEIRAFAKDELKLPVKGQYREFVQLAQPVVAYNVFAAPELSLSPYRWCYLFHAVCVEYRGYFRAVDAQAYAATLRARSWDVHVGGVAAFSTLGLLDDPVTSVLTGYPDDLFAHVLFHELAHSVLYVGDDTVFNESFASAVADAGLDRWLSRRAGTGQPAGDADTVRAIRAAQGVFNAVALELRADLAAVYASSAADDGKRARKRELFAGAASRYRSRCEAQPVAAGLARCPYASWFTVAADGSGLNNASLNAVAAYEALVPAFRRLLDAHDGDFAAFYRTVKAIGNLDPEARSRTLHALLVDEKETAP